MAEACATSHNGANDAKHTKPCPTCAGTGRVRDDRAFGAWVRSVREVRGDSLRVLAAEAGCSSSYLSDLEYGRRSWTSPAALRVLKTLEIA